jgi:hypothetical protein
LRKRAGDLPHHDSGRVAGIGQVVTAGSEHAHATPYQRQNAEFLNDKIPGEPGRIFDDDSADAVAFDPIEQSREAWPGIDGVRTGHRGVIELADNGEASGFRERRNSRALALIAVLVGADVRGAGRSEIRHCLSAV